MSSEVELVLASNSPRRKELLASGGWKFRVQSTEIDENNMPEENPYQYVLRLAEEKARAVAARLNSASIIIGSDTTVIFTPGEAPDQGPVEILGKPATNDEAAEMLDKLRGRVHQVLTAVAVLRTEDDFLQKDVCTTDVRMRNYSQAEVAEYVASGDPLDKAGAYAIQHKGFHPVESIEGCYANVVGLPVCLLARLLAPLGLPSHVQIPPGCPTTFQANCSVCQSMIDHA